MGVAARLEASIPFLALVPDPVLVLDAELRLVYGNPACTRSLGHELDVWRGRPVLDLVHPDDVDLVISRLLTLEGKPIIVRVADDDGGWRYWEMLATVIPDGDLAGGLIVGGRDTTGRHALEVAGNDMPLLRALVNHSSAMLTVIDTDGTVRSISGAFTRELGYNPGLVAGTTYDQWIAPTDRERVARAIEGMAPNSTVTLDAKMLHVDGSEILVDFSIIDLTADPAVNGMVVSGQVANSLRVARQQAEFLASHDLSTGLLNRPGLFEAGQVLEAEAHRTGEPLGVIVLDLDRLSHVNELYGAAVGDAVIQTVAARLSTAVRADDLVCRYDGDEFVVATLGPMDSLLSVRDRLLAAIAEPIPIGDLTVTVTSSSALASGQGSPVLAELVDQASVELEHSHRFSVSAPTLGTAGLAERRVLVDQLQLALDRDELVMWFQPIVDVGGSLLAFEALLRWEHPLRGVLGPAAFLPLVSMAGFENRVNRLVIDQSLAFLAALAGVGRSDVVVHVNVTPTQVGTVGFGDELRRLREAAGVAPHRLCVEITESDVLRISDAALDNLALLRRSGVHIAIDDFGTGFSSLAHLLELPVDMLKIDRRFVSGLGLDPMANSLTTAILGLAGSMGMQCVAEGVETPDQRDQLFRLGCREFQGWLFDAAFPPGAALAHAAGQPARARS